MDAVFFQRASLICCRCMIGCLSESFKVKTRRCFYQKEIEQGTKTVMGQRLISYMQRISSSPLIFAKSILACKTRSKGLLDLQTQGRSIFPSTLHQKLCFPLSSAET